MFFIRAAQTADLDAVVAVSRHLDSVNLPNERERLAELIARSERSFSRELPAPDREFLFVLVDPESATIVGACMIFAQHGNRQAPHVYLDVFSEERYSQSLDRHFHHTVLRIGYNYQGPTEIGGLVLLPTHRARPEKHGKLLAYVRFVYIALHRQLFRDEVLSELMPPLEPDGTSLLWESLGRHFTGLTYQEADRLSRSNKEFIRALFPQDPIWASLLPPAAQSLVGQVGATTKPIERMLRRVGFAYAHRIDPFDGGPHFHCRTDQIATVRDTRRATVRAIQATPAGCVDSVMAVDLPVAPWFRAVRVPVQVEGHDVVIPPDAAEALQVAIGGEVGVCPLP